MTACNFLASKPMQTERQGSVAGRAGRKLPLGHGDRWCMHLRHSYHVLLACADVLPASSHTRGYGVFNLVCTMHAATDISDESDSGLRCWLATTSESILQVPSAGGVPSCVNPGCEHSPCRDRADDVTGESGGPSGCCRLPCQGAIRLADVA